MKRIIISLTFLLTIGFMSFGQVTDTFIGNCATNTGPDAKYLKDYRIQLGKAVSRGDLRYKAKISLWKNTKYRFTMCNAEDSQGQLIFAINDDTDKLILSSYNKKTDRTYSHIDFECQKSGIYKISFDFTKGQSGSGVGIVSMIK